VSVIEIGGKTDRLMTSI